MTKRKPIKVSEEDIRVRLERMVTLGFACRTRDGKYKMTERGLTISDEELEAQVEVWLAPPGTSRPRFPWEEVACMAVRIYTKNLGWPPPSDAALDDVKSELGEILTATRSALTRDGHDPADLPF